MKKQTRYELGEHIASGENSTIYRLKNKKNLVAKVFNCFSDPEYASNNCLIQIYLDNELKTGKFLKQKGISVPRYVGNCKVSGKLIDETSKKITEKSYDAEATILEFIEDSISIKEHDKKNTEVYERGLELLKQEKEKLNNINVCPGGDFQGIYSQKRDKIYLVDFESYSIPK